MLAVPVPCALNETNRPTKPASWNLVRGGRGGF